MFRVLSTSAVGRFLAPIFVSLVLVLATFVPSSASDDESSDGRIVFVKHNWPANTRTVFVVDPDGTHLRKLSPWKSEFLEPTWSPDGSELNIAGDACGVIHKQYCSTVIVNPDTVAYRWLRAKHVFFDCTGACYIGGFSCPIWTRDGERLGCAGASEQHPTRTGIYTVRSSDGGGLNKILSFDPAKHWSTTPQAKDFSPDGDRLLYEQAAGVHRSGLFSVALDGTDKQRVSPEGLILDHDDAATYSPSGDWILFSAFPKENHRKTVYLVRPDGSELHEMFPECGGSFTTPLPIGCKSASWSPDGSRIVYFRSAPNAQGAYIDRILSVKIDGSDQHEIVRATNDSQLEPEFPYWGATPESSED